jgi:hypothetical protein
VSPAGHLKDRHHELHNVSAHPGSSSPPVPMKKYFNADNFVTLVVVFIGTTLAIYMAPTIIAWLPKRSSAS